MNRYLITGAAGMLGHDLRSTLAGRAVTALSHSDLDITDAAAVEAAVAGHDVVVNAAAYTDVDAAETDEARAHAVNAVGAANLAAAAGRTGARLVQVSTDYVFSGNSDRPYPEDAPLQPVSAYGRSKAEGEQLVLATAPSHAYIVRAAWLYGAHGPNFARTMLALASSRESWEVVDDQVGQPTWTADLAGKIVELVDADAPPGIYHGTNGGSTTWFGFARAVLEEAGLDPERIAPTDSASFRRPAPRPAYSVLAHGAWRTAGLDAPRDWRAALAAASAAGVLAA